MGFLESYFIADESPSTPGNSAGDVTKGREMTLPLSKKTRRAGAIAVENAIIFPVFCFLVLAIIVGGNGVFRAQQVSLLAQEASRWAAVHGSNWAKITQSAPSTRQDLYDQAVAPLVMGLYTDKLTVQVWWVDGITGDATDWDSSSRAPTTLDASNKTVSNRVRVTVTYQWIPGALFTGPWFLQSTSEIPLFS